MGHHDGVRGDVDVLERERASTTNLPNYGNTLISITDLPQKEDLQQEAYLFKMFRCFKDVARM